MLADQRIATATAVKSALLQCQEDKNPSLPETSYNISQFNFFLPICCKNYLYYHIQTRFYFLKWEIEIIYIYVLLDFEEYREY